MSLLQCQENQADDVFLRRHRRQIRRQFELFLVRFNQLQYDLRRLAPWRFATKSRSIF
jgi:hypothetical protein